MDVTTALALCFLITTVHAKIYVDDACLKCLCLMKTGCDITRGCSENLCGLFEISKDYWIDAGRNVIDGDDPNGEGAFERCTREPFCASETVRRYFKRYGKFSGSAPSMCEEMALIHINGPYSVRNKESILIKEIVSCYNQSDPQ